MRNIYLICFCHGIHPGVSSQRFECAVLTIQYTHFDNHWQHMNLNIAAVAIYGSQPFLLICEPPVGQPLSALCVNLNRSLYRPRKQSSLYISLFLDDLLQHETVVHIWTAGAAMIRDKTVFWLPQIPVNQKPVLHWAGKSEFKNEGIEWTISKLSVSKVDHGYSWLVR